MKLSTQLRGFELQNVLVAHASELAPISTSVVELTAVCIEPDWYVGNACDVIDSDPLLLGAVLREANSAVFAAATLVGSSRDAVVRLGAARIMSLAIEMGLETLLGGSSTYGSRSLEVFRHSYATSVAAEVIRDRARVRLPHVFAAAALLHDVGELVLSQHLEPSGAEQLEIAHQRGMSQCEAERSVLDLDHAEVSAMICQQWRLPQAISHAAQHHHDPWLGDDPLCYGVALADQVAETALSYSLYSKVADSLTVGRCMVELDLQHSSVADLARETLAKMESYNRSFV